MNAYFITGMATDERVFQNIILPPGYSIHHLSWIKPLNGESLAEYALRLAQGIDKSKPFVLLGYSMGGMMVTEIAKIFKPQKLILISSAPVADELPKFFKLLYQLKAYNYLSVSVLKNASILKKVFGRYQPEYRKLIIRVIRDSDPIMIKWSLKAVGEWNNKDYPKYYYHIHGDHDNVLPSKNTNASYIIKGGRHFMLLERSAEINKILKEIL